MQNLRTLIIQFENEIGFHEIIHFRGAAIASMDQKDILFHNHDNDKLRYSYPLIQYKRIHKKAAVFAVGKGVEVVSQILNARSFKYQIGNSIYEMRIESVQFHDDSLLLKESSSLHYRLQSWLPLNSSNYAKYKSSESIVDRVEILEKVLIGNILSFLKGVGMYSEQAIKVRITDIVAQRVIVYKRVKLMAFDIEFKCNITLPQYIGLGKNASIGYGTLTKVTN